MECTVILKKMANNYSAYAPDLPDCITTGPSVEETIVNMREAIEFHLEGTREDGAPILSRGPSRLSSR